MLPIFGLATKFGYLVPVGYIFQLCQSVPFHTTWRLHLDSLTPACDVNLT